MADFDAETIARLGWRQGAVLGQGLAESARPHAPPGIRHDPSDWLIVTSHDCDIVNFSIEKEPFVEVLRATVVERKAPDGQLNWGRNPRTLQFETADGQENVVLQVVCHDRWPIPRGLLMDERPEKVVPNKIRRLIAEWLAKRYIRSAFPSAFDRRWRGKGGRNLKTWTDLLAKHRDWVQGVYLRLSTLKELDETKPYRCQLIVAVPANKKKKSGWAQEKNQIESDVEEFWGEFDPGIIFDGCDVLGTDDITLAEFEMHQRFDADWLSFADDGDTTPAAADMTS